MTTGGENNIGYEYGEYHSNQIKQALSVLEENGKSKGHNAAIRMVEERRTYEGENNPFYGKVHSEKSKEKMRKPKSNTENMSKTDETKKKISEALKGKTNAKDKTWTCKTQICPHCNKEGRGGNMTRYHFDNCKKKE